MATAMVMNGSRSGLLPDLDSLSSGISNDGCVQDLPEPQGSTGSSAMTTLGVELRTAYLDFRGFPLKTVTMQLEQLTPSLYWLTSVCY